MAFVKSRGSVVSFAETSDVSNRDQVIFDENEGLTEDVIDPMLVRATERILIKIRVSEWWRDYFPLHSTAGLRTVADIPSPNANYILARKSDFTDLCVYVALAEFILPTVADFGNEDTAERQKMDYYKKKSEDLLEELLMAGDWYDFDGSGAISSMEKLPGFKTLRRVR